MLAERIDVEAEALRAVSGRDRLLFQIDDQFETRKRGGVVEELVDLGFGEGDRQETVLQRIVLENLAERRRDHRAKAVIAQRPGRVLARRADAEVAAGKQDL